MSLRNQGGVAQILIYLWTGECFCRSSFTYFLINDYILWGSSLLVFNAVKQSWFEMHVAWIMQEALESHPLHFCLAAGNVLIIHAPPLGNKIKLIPHHSCVVISPALCRNHLKGMRISFSKCTVYIACDNRWCAILIKTKVQFLRKCYWTKA